ncbi:MAG: molybdopterin-dependent oxidoreductase [Deltaproteobacteria bacterium]|jgi:anaerobic selenocysteine-containing dehydrogenase|nr:molybdopterin-dependent oxidoreductase [Deltaproteobacteria bacterium]
MNRTVNVTRRTSIKQVAAAGLLAFSPLSWATALVREAKAALARIKLSECKTYRSSCAMECLHCNLTAFVYNNKLIKVEASKDFNVKCCLRGISRTKWVYHKKRLTTPLLRTGKKGSGEFKSITWDEAFDLIEKNIKQTIAEYGHEGLLLNTGSGHMDTMQNSMSHAFFDYLGGATRPVGTLCCSAVSEAMIPMVGIRYADTRDTIKDSRYILCWGNNPAVTMQAYFKDYLEARKNGAKIVVIDPRFSETAARGDEWVPIVPGTDTALALGMIRVIMEERLYDAPYLKAHTGAVYLVDADGRQRRADAAIKDSYLVYDTLTRQTVRHDTPGIDPALTRDELPAGFAYTTVFELIRKESAPWTLTKVEEETDVPKQTTLRLAREYSCNKPSMLIQNMSGAQRTEFGAFVVASQFYLALLTGNVGKAGGGVMDAGGVTQMIKVNPPIPPAPNVKKIKPIPISNIGAAVYSGKPYHINFWWITTTSPMTQFPNTNIVRKALEKVPFVVVVDNLMTSTAKYADLVLPTTTVFEETSLMAGIRSHYVQLMEEAVPPPGEARPNRWIFAQLAKRFGFGEVFDKHVEHFINTCLDGTGITLEQLRKSPVKPVPYPWIPFKDGVFRTSTKKAHFFIEDWTKHGFPPIATYMQVKESPKGSPELAQKYPLMAVQRKLARSVHSSHGMNEWILDVHRAKANVIIHPEDARPRGVQNNGWVRVFNERGEHRAVAVVTRQIKQGVVCLDNGWWEEQGGSSSVVTNDQIGILGNGHCCNSTLVDVRAEA